MFKFKDFNQAAIARLVNPPRRQLSLMQMQSDMQILEHFKIPRRAVAFTPTARPFLGQIRWKYDEFQFHCRDGTRQIRNKQRLIISFTLDGIEHYTQIETKLIYPTYFLLGALPLRYHQRFNIQAPIWIHPVSYDDETAFITGEIMIRRTQRHAVAMTGVHYFVHEKIVKDSGQQVTDYLLANSEIQIGHLVEISQGGCSITTNRDAESIFKATRMLYLTTTLDDGRRVGNINCFIAVRKLQTQARTLVLRCSFLESLPLAIDQLRNGVRLYEIRFDEAAKFILNSLAGDTTGTLQTHLPYGDNQLHIKWARGTETTHTLTINSRTSSTFRISPDKGLVLDQDLKKSS